MKRGVWTPRQDARRLFARIAGLTRRNRGLGGMPEPGCDCPDCMRFRAIRKLAVAGSRMRFLADPPKLVPAAELTRKPKRRKR